MNKPGVDPNATLLGGKKKNNFFLITISAFVAKTFLVDSWLYLCQSGKN